MKRALFALLAVLWLPAVHVCAGNGYDLLPDYVTTQSGGSGFCIADGGQVCDLCVDPADWAGVRRAAGDLCADIGRVTGRRARLEESDALPHRAIIVGTIGRSKLIDRLIADKKLDVRGVAGQWESFVIATVDENLVVAGSDKRGTIYGIYDISEKIGVSPWYYWADVPVRRSEALYVKSGRYVQPAPKVKYRGIFINDEWPSFGGWATAKFGGLNARMYATLFELLLRLKANYLWPAMWATAFNEDDPLNPQTADEYGIVMGTSHHEPMMRAHKEYTSRRSEVGAWDYRTNAANLDRFFREGLERNKPYESLITIGMRGDGDVAMGRGDDEENMRTLEQVVASQRRIIEEVYGCPPDEVPQLWAIFTEVQRYYDAGFRVPEDVTLLFCDNNWGSIRRTAPPEERHRRGGFGMYYHIDMNGGPASDRWVNTTTPARLREQLNLAYRSGIDRIWIINVGDVKPKEMPIDFILRYAWNPEAIGPNDTDAYLETWAARIFGPGEAPAIARIVDDYSRYNLMRKPEVQHPGIFSVVNHDEADSMLGLWRDVAERAKRIEPRIAPEARDAYYQLVYYPAVGSAGVGEIYLAAAKNKLYAAQGRPSANRQADRAAVLFEEDKRLTAHYNLVMSGAKWQHMMSDNHIGYTSWQIPKENSLPPLQRVTPAAAPALGVALSGSTQAWPGSEAAAALPRFDRLSANRYCIEVFNRGTGRIDYRLTADRPWIRPERSAGSVIGDHDARIGISVDWEQLPEGLSTGTIEVSDGTTSVTVAVSALNYALPECAGRYFGGSGEFSIPATAWSANRPGRRASWIPAPGLGRDRGCMLSDDVTAPSADLRKLRTAPCLEYAIFLPEAEEALTVAIGIQPTQDIRPARGLRMAVAVDDGPIQVIDARQGMHDEFGEYTAENLRRSPQIRPLPPLPSRLALRGHGQARRRDVFDGIRWIETSLGAAEPGLHRLRIYMVDPEIVLERIVVHPDNRYPSYWGTPPLAH